MADSPAVTILLLGEENVGKTTFLSRISKGNLSIGENGPITLLRDIDQPFVYDIRLYNRPYRFEFYDTASPESWALLKPTIIVLCFDISNRLSLINMQRRWTTQIYTHFTSVKDLPVLVLGLKRDLRSETDPNGIIYPQEAYRVAQEMRCDKYIECSALTGELMTEAFEDICRTAALATTTNGGMTEGGCAVM